MDKRIVVLTALVLVVGSSLGTGLGFAQSEESSPGAPVPTQSPNSTPNASATKYRLTA